MRFFIKPIDGVRKMDVKIKVVLKPGEVCPYCGQKKRGGWKNESALENLSKRKSKGGRPKGSKNKPKF